MMRPPQGRRRVVVAVAALALVVGLGLWPLGLDWRVKVVFLKIRGQVSGMTWGEVLRGLVPGAGYRVEGLLTTRGNPYEAIDDRYTSAADLDAGKKVYDGTCAACHRTAGVAPDLLSAPIQRSAKPWGLYQTIKHGLPQTPMAAQSISEAQRWQVIAYVLSARRRLEAAAGGLPPNVPTPVVPGAALLRSAPTRENWPTYSGTYSGQRYSALREVNRTTVPRLHPLWAFQLPAEVLTNESSPVVVGNVMYVTTSNQVWALNASTGAPYWHFNHDLDSHLSLCCGSVNRGVAVLDSTVFVGTLDAYLVALNARTGAIRWFVQVGDPAQGYSITAAPLAVKDRVLTGVGGGEFGMSGYVDAYDANTGRRLWRFHTVPQPGEPGHDSWGSESWRRGGAPTWLTGSYDPALDLVYWGVGNPGPNFNDSERPGTNLYSNSVVALNLATGALRWYFQFTPRDTHDLDAAQIPVLADVPFRGRLRHLMFWANRNAFYYVLDRVTGQVLVATPFEEQTWALGVDSTGRATINDQALPSDTGTLAYPSAMGATNWWSPAYDPTRQLFFVPTAHVPGIFYRGPVTAPQGGMYMGSADNVALREPHWNNIKAIDATTGHLRWEVRLPSVDGSLVMGGLVATAGDLVFAGHASDFLAFDAATGHERWRFNTGARITAAPIVFANGSHERIAVVAGRTLLTFGIDDAVTP